MSWNNALPFWVYASSHEHELAKMSCAFEEEWFSGTSRELPKHLLSTSKATFSSWKYGGWNYRYSKEEIKGLMSKSIDAQ